MDATYNFKPIALITKTESLKDPLKFKHYFESIPKYRKERLERFKRDDDKHMSLAAFILLQTALSKSGIKPDSLKIIYGENQKPYFKDSNLYFNLSHSDNVAACVLSPYEIGCDVEHVDSNRMIIAKRKFCTEEYEMLLNEKNEADQNKLFSRIWTVKESVLKAIGTGLTIPLNSFSVSFNTDKIHVNSEKVETDLFYKEYTVYDEFSFSCSCSFKNGLPDSVEFIEL